MRLLIVEDNERLAGLIAEGLGRRGFICDMAPDLATAEDSLVPNSMRSSLIWGCPMATGSPGCSISVPFASWCPR